MNILLFAAWIAVIVSVVLFSRKVARSETKTTVTKSSPIFERYVHSARRAIFFARWQAQQLGASAIRPEHLLLGLMVDQNTPVRSFLLLDWDSWFESEVKRNTTIATPLPKETNLPLHNASKRVLAYTVEEANSLSNKHIGTEHLLLGLIREKRSIAADLIQQKGLDLKTTRKTIQSCPLDEFWLQ